MGVSGRMCVGVSVWVSSVGQQCTSVCVVCVRVGCECVWSAVYICVCGRVC